MVHTLVKSTVARRGQLLLHPPILLQSTLTFGTPTFHVGGLDHDKLRLWFNRDFLGVTAREMFSSLSKGEMMRRVRRFIPGLRAEHLQERGFAGIRSNVLSRRGAMLKEAVELQGPHSYHIINYNSPGATGAPAYAAYLVDRLAARGDLDHLTPSTKKTAWDWDAIAKAMEFVA